MLGYHDATLMVSFITSSFKPDFRCSIPGHDSFRSSSENVTFCNLRLPVQLVLAIELGYHRKLFTTFQKDRADDNLVTENGLVVVEVRGAVRAIVAVDGFALRDVQQNSSLIVNPGNGSEESHRTVPESPW